MRSIFIPALLSLAAPAAAQVTLSLDALTPITSRASVPIGPPVTETIPAGPLNPSAVSQLATAFHPSLGLAESGIRIDTAGNDRLDILVSARATAMSSTATTDRFGLLLNVQVAVPNAQAELQINATGTAVGLGTSYAAIDIGDDGTYDFQSYGAAASATIPLRLLAGQVPVRIVMTATASDSGSMHSHGLSLAVHPASNCTATALGTGSCQPLIPTSLRPNFFGGFDYRLGATVPASTFLVLGVQRLALRFPAPGPSRCQLDPAPEVIIPMTTRPFGVIGTIPALPATISRLEFYAQPVALDFAANRVTTYPTYRIACR